VVAGEVVKWRCRVIDATVVLMVLTRELPAVGEFRAAERKV